MATAPFNINEAIPGDTDLVSAHPSGARTFRDVVESWILVEHDTYGHHKVPSGSTASRDAQDNTAAGNLWLRTDTTPATLQRYNGSAWEDVSAGNAATADAADTIAAGGVAAASLGADVFDGLTSVTPATGDLVPLGDVSDSGNPKNATISDILALIPSPEFLQYQEQRTSGTAGPTYTASGWRTVSFNTEVQDTGGNGSVSSNAITLAAGTYVFWAQITLGVVTGQTRLRLQNTSDATTVVQSTQGNSNPAATTIAAYEVLMGYFVIAGTKTFEVQVYPTVSNNNAAMSTGEVEIYSNIFLQKIA